MTLYTCGAHIDEKGRASGGKPGDQTGEEVSVSVYSNYAYGGWDGVLRYTGSGATRVRNRMMKAAYRLASSNLVGYAQNTRTGLYYELKAFKWLLRKVKKITKCNTDCSTFMTAVANVAGVPIHKFAALPDWIWTGVMVDEFTDRGFEWIVSGINWNTGKGLKPGDILLNEANHTEMFMGNKKSGQLYDGDSSSTGSNSKPSSAVAPSKSLDVIAEEVLAGEWGNGDERIKALKKAGYDPVAVQKRVNELAVKYGM